MTEHPSHKLSKDKRARLFQIASAEFAALGFSRASLNRIIGEMGMSKSSFYHYFENKTDLFKQTLDQAMDPFLTARAQFDLDLLTKETFWPGVEMMTREMAHMANRSPELVTVGRMFYRSRENPEEAALTEDVMALSIDWLAGLIRRGQELELLRDDLPESFVIETLMALGMSMDRWVLSHWDELSDEERMKLNAQAFDLFVRMLEPR